MSVKHVLAFESSCDDTSVAIVSSEGEIRALCSANQDIHHQLFGGVVPEIASRNHTLTLLPLVKKALEISGFAPEDLDGIAVTSRPGLVGSLMVAVMTAKTLSWLWEKPLVDVNHIEAHLLSPFLRNKNYAPPEDFNYPYLALAVSGGHTHLCHVRDLGDYEVLGQTRDDAAGEAFDKFAKMMGLGFPGGVKVDKLAQLGNPKAYSFPKPLTQTKSLEFSFSGLKTSAKNLIQNEENLNTEDLCASYQETIVEVLLEKLALAQEKTQLKQVVLTGGVSANSRLRKKAQEWGQAKGISVVIPPIEFCTDNGAMVGYVGVQKLLRGQVADLNLQARPSHLPSDFKSHVSS